MSQTQLYPGVQVAPADSNKELRAAIVASAVALVSTAGYQGLTLKEVARCTGVAATSPRRLFGDRQGLLAAVAEAGFSALYAAIDSAVASVPAVDSPQRLHVTANVWVRFARRHPEQYRVMFATPRSRDTNHRGPSGLLGASALRVFGRLVRFIEQGQSSGRIRQWPAQELALVIWSSVHGLSMLIVDGQLADLGVADDAAERLSGVVWARVLQGLAT